MEQESVADWMIEFEQEMKVAFRIACPEVGYPESEAMYPTVADWEKKYKRNWSEFLSRMI